MTLEQRIDELEQQNHGVKRTGVLGLGIVLATLLLCSGGLLINQVDAQARTKPDVVSASEYRLVDHHGKAHAGLTLHEDEPILGLLDKQGDTRVVLGIRKGDPGLTFFDEQGRLRAGLGLRKYNSVLVFSDEQGEVRAGLVLVKDRPGLALYDEQGCAIWDAP